MNRYDVFLEELAGHMQTLEKYALAFPDMSCVEKEKVAGAAIYSIWALLEKYKGSRVLETAGRGKSFKDRFLAILRRIYVVLSLIYLPNTTGALRDWTERAVHAVGDPLIQYAWG
jgi:hypothetical protein